jgi:hypothetical protein
VYQIVDLAEMWGSFAAPVLFFTLSPVGVFDTEEFLDTEVTEIRRDLED